MKRYENIKYFILCVIIGGVLINVGCIRRSASNIIVVHDTVVPTNVEKTIFNLRVQIDLLKDSIIILNDKLDQLQLLNDKFDRLPYRTKSKTADNNRPLLGDSTRKQAVYAAIAKLNKPSFTQKDLDIAIAAAKKAGIKKTNQALFDACQQVLNFCTDKDGRKNSPDLLKQWVNDTWSTRGKFGDLPKGVKKPLQELVQDEKLYNHYTHSTKSYSSLQDMLNELNDY